MDSKYSKKIQEILSYSREEAIRLGNHAIQPEHIFLGILRDGEGLAINVLRELGLNIAEAKEAIETKIRNPILEPVAADSDSIPLYKSTVRVLKLVNLVARELKSNTINSIHLLLAILKDEGSIVTQLLEEKDIDYTVV